jgi:hypothetical protein
MNRTFIHLILFSFSFTTFSCSNDLSRDEAMNQLNQKVDKNEINTKCVFNIIKSWRSDYRSSGFCTVSIMNPPNARDIKMLNSFIENGLITLKQEPVYRDCSQWTLNSIELTEQGAQYLVNESESKYSILSAEFQIDEITGIIQDDEMGHAIVEYELKSANKTPFADYRDSNCFETDKTYKATFSKYDDGWRID